MFVADLCNIFIYIIKWFLKSLACFEAIRSTKTILIEECILLNKYDKKKYFGIFEKETSKSNMSQIKVNVGHYIWACNYR